MLYCFFQYEGVLIILNILCNKKLMKNIRVIFMFYWIVFLMCALHVVDAETILYSSPTSSSSLRVRIILYYKNIPVMGTIPLYFLKLLS